MAALQLPVVLTKLSYLIDNPWAVSLDRATMAGLILADSLVDRNLGTRPITLVGYSLGSRVIFSCLQELARKGAYGVVQNAFMFGSPVVAKEDDYKRVRSVVAGRFVNGYNRNDWILGYLFRLTHGGIRRVAGLTAIENIDGIENMDVTEFVVGHMDYRTAMPRLLRECGWMVESDEFTEIEDPDPENHAVRQRELISEIEEARKELEKEGKASTKKGGAFSFFSRKKKSDKQEWEIYEDLAKQRQAEVAAAQGAGATGGKTEDAEGNNHGILFDVDAIRAELAKERNTSKEAVDLQLEQLQVRELESTLPPMKLNYSPIPSPAPTIPRPPQPLHSPRMSLSGRRVVTDTAVAYGASQDYSRRPASANREPEGRISEERTPTMPKQMTLSPRDEKPPALPVPPPYKASPAVVDSDGISMTFDLTYDDDEPALRPQTAQRAATSPLTPLTPLSPNGAAPPPPPPKDTVYNRNDPSPAATGASPGAVAAGVAAGVMLTDPWNEVDEDDEEFGKEKEISMTFA